jgi:hypothetical protein
MASSLGIWWCLLLDRVLPSDTWWYLSIFPSTSSSLRFGFSDEVTGIDPNATKRSENEKNIFNPVTPDWSEADQYQ